MIGILDDFPRGWAEVPVAPNKPQEAVRVNEVPQVRRCLIELDLMCHLDLLLCSKRLPSPRNVI